MLRKPASWIHFRIVEYVGGSGLLILLTVKELESLLRLCFLHIQATLSFLLRSTIIPPSSMITRSESCCCLKKIRTENQKQLSKDQKREGVSIPSALERICKEKCDSLCWMSLAHVKGKLEICSLLRLAITTCSTGASPILTTRKGRRSERLSKLKARFFALRKMVI